MPQPFDYLINRPFHVFDTETTGLGPSAEICEICVMDRDGTVLVDTLVKPMGPITEGAFNVHGISEAEVKDAPSWRDVAEQIQHISNGNVAVAYNAKFDINLMIQSSNALGDVVDPKFGYDDYFCAMTEYSKRAKIFDFMRKQNKWFKLIEAAALEGVHPEGKLHRAKADVDLTRRMVLKILSEAT